MPLSSSRLQRSASNPHRHEPIKLHTLSLALSSLGITGYGEVLSFFDPARLEISPLFSLVSRWRYSCDMSAWRTISGWWVSGRLCHVVMAGCTVTGTEGAAGAVRLERDWLLLPPDGADAHSTIKTASITYDLRKLPPVTIPFYTDLLPRLRHDGVFLSLPPAASPTPSTDDGDTQGRVHIIVSREREKFWIERGLEGWDERDSVVISFSAADS